MSEPREVGTAPESPVAEVAERVKHVHKWQPNGTATDRLVHRSPVSAMDHMEEIGT